MKKITIIGLGALGSHAVLGLRNVGQLKFVDFDLVEQKNTLAQFHSKMGLRRNKALSLQQAFLGMWGIKAGATPHKVTVDNVAVVLKGADLVLDCTDNIAARATLKQFCVANDIPLLHTAMSADGGFAQIIWTELFTADAESGGGATCEDGENLPFHLLVGGFIAQTAKTFITTGRKDNFQLTPTGVVRV